MQAFCRKLCGVEQHQDYNQSRVSTRSQGIQGTLIWSTNSLLEAAQKGHLPLLTFSSQTCLADYAVRIPSAARFSPTASAYIPEGHSALETLFDPGTVKG